MNSLDKPNSKISFEEEIRIIKEGPECWEPNYYSHIFDKNIAIPSCDFKIKEEVSSNLSGKEFRIPNYYIVYKELDRSKRLFHNLSYELSIYDLHFRKMIDHISEENLASILTILDSHCESTRCQNFEDTDQDLRDVFEKLFPDLSSDLPIIYKVSK